MVIITLAIESHVCIKILDNYLIRSIENWFDNDAGIFQENSDFCHGAKGIYVFLREIYIKSITLSADSSDLNPIENLWTF